MRLCGNISATMSFSSRIREPAPLVSPHLFSPPISYRLDPLLFPRHLPLQKETSSKSSFPLPPISVPPIPATPVLSLSSSYPHVLCGPTGGMIVVSP